MGFFWGLPLPIPCYFWTLVLTLLPSQRCVSAEELCRTCLLAVTNDLQNAPHLMMPHVVQIMQNIWDASTRKQKMKMPIGTQKNCLICEVAKLCVCQTREKSQLFNLSCRISLFQDTGVFVIIGFCVFCCVCLFCLCVLLQSRRSEDFFCSNVQH